MEKEGTIKFKFTVDVEAGQYADEPRVDWRKFMVSNSLFLNDNWDVFKSFASKNPVPFNFYAAKNRGSNPAASLMGMSFLKDVPAGPIFLPPAATVSAAAAEPADELKEFVKKHRLTGDRSPVGRVGDEMAEGESMLTILQKRLKAGNCLVCGDPGEVVAAAGVCKAHGKIWG